MCENRVWYVHGKNIPQKPKKVPAMQSKYAVSLKSGLYVIGGASGRWLRLGRRVFMNRFASVSRRSAINAFTLSRLILLLLSDHYYAKEPNRNTRT